MIPDEMSGAYHSTRNVRPHFDELSDQEECSSHFMLCEHFEESQRVRIIGSIVVCQTDLAGITAKRNRTPVKLRCWTVAVVTEP